MPFPQLPLAKADGVALLRARAAELRVVVEAQATPNPDARDAMGWTASDHLMHIVAWHRRLLTWMADESAGRAVVRPEPGFTFDQIDELNERDHQANRGTPLTEAWRQFEETYAAVLAIFDGLSDEDLNDAGRYDWLTDGAVLWHAIGGNTFDHYEEHVEMLGGSGGDTAASG